MRGRHPNLTPTLSPRCRHKETQAPRADAWSLLDECLAGGRHVPATSPRPPPLQPPPARGAVHSRPRTSPEGSLSRLITPGKAHDGWTQEHMTQLVLTAWPGLPGPHPASGRLLGLRKSGRPLSCSLGEEPCREPAAEQGARVLAAESKWSGRAGPGNTRPHPPRPSVCPGPR